MAGELTLKTYIFAIIGGAGPAILWLWFWLRSEDSEHPEPKGMIIATFLTGALSVLLAIGAEKLFAHVFADQSLQVTLWAGIEEFIKFLAVMVIIKGSGVLNEPIDYPMYFIAGALGFAALENILFLIEPIAINGAVVGALTGNLRFLGSTLLHATASGMIGSALGLSFYFGHKNTFLYFIIGLASAITLHSMFNLFIMKENGENFLQVFGFLWIIVIINILILEKLKRMSHENIS